MFFPSFAYQPRLARQKMAPVAASFFSSQFSHAATLPKGWAYRSLEWTDIIIVVESRLEDRCHEPVMISRQAGSAEAGIWTYVDGTASAMVRRPAVFCQLFLPTTSRNC